MSFSEGDVIKIVSKLGSDGVDDGWWTGEYNGKVGTQESYAFDLFLDIINMRSLITGEFQTGTFPSLVVEEIKHTGEPQTPITPMIQTPDGLPPPPNFEPPKPIQTPSEEAPEPLGSVDEDGEDTGPSSGPPPLPPPPAPVPTSTVSIFWIFMKVGIDSLVRS